MAATIYEPLSTAHLKSCTVDFDSRPDKKAVNLVQYDQTIPVLCVSLKKGGTEYKVPSDADVNIRMDKRDGYHVYNPALGVNAERTIAYFAVTPQMSTGWGDYYPIVEITVGGGVAGSAPIWLHFDRNPLPENAIISSDEYKTIQQLLEDVKAVKADTEAIKTATEQIKAQTEAVRDQAKGFADNAKNSADKAQTLVDGMPSDYSQAMKDIGTLKNQMQRAYPDDSTIGENPWSSKNIVDMLCPPLEESGNPVVCYPVAGYPLGVKAKWEPAQEGSGTPYPAGGGKNLFNPAWMPEKAMSNGVTWTITPDGTVTANGTANGTTYYNSDKFSLPAGTYTISAMSHFRISILNKDADGAMIATQAVGRPHTFTVENDIQNATLFFAASGTLDNVSAKPQIEKGATATAYSPYANIRPIKGRDSVTITRQEDNQVITLNMSETVYSGEVDAVTGDGKETRKTLTLDGTTNKFTQRDRYWNLPQNSAPGIADSYDTTCSHFPANTFGGNSRGKYLYTTAQRMSKYFPDANALNAYLVAQYVAGSPVQVYYNLTEPVPFTATGAQPIPALAGANTVLTDADSATVTGRADPIKRITDLEDAVASQT